MIQAILGALQLVLLASIWGALNRIGSRLYEANEHLRSIDYYCAQVSAPAQTGNPDTALLERH